ncbi:putative membrane protein [Sphingobium fontiphilum]|uniref:Putative membrane protein n=1 Tax=Sphingobium fontiphilum TaxID=944425 RepID=A0A7W6DKD5_9SPHN|nr:membrane-like protein [Sphingobium fontiphilum]MBB3982197.1 putative membrane protein [Sphingobium fontiphilum]
MRRRPCPLLAGLLLAASCAAQPADNAATADNATSPADNGVIAPVASGDIANAAVANAVAPQSPAARPVDSRQAAPSPRPARAPDPDYRAIGTEPFWAVTISGDHLRLTRPDHDPVERRGLIRDDDGRTLRYQAADIAIIVTPGPCSDGMSDAVWSDRVQIAFAEGTLKGCGGDRDDGWKDAP